MDPEPPFSSDERERDPGVEDRSGQAEAFADHLPDLAGPAFWHTILATESARCARYQRPATVVFVEIVGVEGAFDAWGGGASGELLTTVAAILRATSRTSDHIARLANGRFGLILTETDEVAAINFVERARERCEREARVEGTQVAFGWANATADTTLLAAADLAEKRLRADHGD